MMEHKLNPVLIMVTAGAVIGISLYINQVSYRNIVFGKMLIFLVIGGLMFLYGAARYLLEKPKQQVAHQRPPTLDHRPQVHCQNCKTRVPSHARFCPWCGHRPH